MAQSLGVAASVHGVFQFIDGARLLGLPGIWSMGWGGAWCAGNLGVYSAGRHMCRKALWFIAAWLLMAPA
jgi:UPF0716 family protein affecting phage T7 exclusion